MLRSLENTPPFFYLAVGAIGATATYLLYPSVRPTRRSRKSSLYGHPRGLINNGNECFMNVILQSLAASTTKTLEWLRINADSSSKMFDALFKLTCLINRHELLDDIEEVEEVELSSGEKKPGDNDDELAKVKEDHNEFAAARVLKRALNAHNWRVRTEEHDCHELFHLIMSTLEDELNAKVKSRRSLNFFKQPSLQMTQSSVGLENSLPMALAHNPFHGYLAVQLQCLDCNYKYPLKFESFYSLSLSLPRANQSQLLSPNPFQPANLTLYDCLRSFFNFELLADMKCEQCNKDGANKKPRGFIKRQAIAKLPECLCIHIQRNCWSEYDSAMVKKSNFVQFPLTIKVDEYSMSNSSPFNSNAFSFKQVGIGSLIGRRSRGNSTSNLSNSLPTLSGSLYQPSHSYELSSAIAHFGTALSGHFVAYRKTLDGAAKQSWLQCSDHDIKEISLSNLLNTNVYMLFYDKKII